MSEQERRQEYASLEEESRITPDVVARVGIDVDELAALMLLESVKQFGPQKFKELHLAALAPADVLQEPDRLPIRGKRGETFRAAIAALDAEARTLARARAVRQIVRAAENEAHILSYMSPDYPANVFESNNPVPILYVRGSMEVLNRRRAVACVGSRQIRDPYKTRHRAFAEMAASDGFAIASGFATGADRIGHEAAWESGGATVLVMPCGLDRPFPPENKDLWFQLLHYPGAAVVSEFHFGTKAAALTLRKRNKLIVALARGVLMSQSAATGGAMNAYKFAIEQRKPVATFSSDGTPGTGGNVQIAEGPPPRRNDPDDPSLFGRNGAKPTTVFPAERDAPSEWREWLHRLSSST